MGYKPASEKAMKISYPSFPGLEVYALTPEMGELMELSDMKINFNAALEQRMYVFETFSKYITSWNIEHPKPKRVKTVDGTEVCARCGLAEDMPLPTTAEHMMCLSIKFIMPVFFGWLTAVSRVDPTEFMNLNLGEKTFQEDMMTQLGKLQSPLPSSEPNLS